MSAVNAAFFVVGKIFLIQNILIEEYITAVYFVVYNLKEDFYLESDNKKDFGSKCHDWRTYAICDGRE